MGQAAEVRRAVLLRGMGERGLRMSPAIAGAFGAVPREAFLPGVPLEEVYADRAIVTHRSADGMPTSSSSQPYVMAAMLGQLGVGEGDRVLEIGAGTGYNAAILARLVGPTGRVISVDVEPELVAVAGERLAALGLAQASTVAGEGWLGLPDSAPYDRILATVGVWDISPQWTEQLTEEGTMVVPIWLRPGLQLSLAFRKDGDELRCVDSLPCGFMRLRGPHAGPECYREVAPAVMASLDRDDSEVVRALTGLLAGRPTIMGIPALAEGWMVRLMLDERHPVQLSGHVPTGVAAGVLRLEPEQGLALVVGRELWVYGAAAVGEELVGRLRAAGPLPLSRLRVRAVPTGDDRSTARWVLRRPAYTLLLDED